MMMKMLGIMLLFMVSTATASVALSTRPFPSPLPPQTLHPIPPSFSDPKAQKCLQDFRIEKDCVLQIIRSFGLPNTKLDPSCCTVISAINEDCVSPIFANFNNPFFGELLKDYCSSSPPPSTPSPTPPSPSEPSPPYW